MRLFVCVSVSLFVIVTSVLCCVLSFFDLMRHAFRLRFLV